jgi:hypothetical protein
LVCDGGASLTKKTPDLYGSGVNIAGDRERRGGDVAARWFLFEGVFDEFKRLRLIKHYGDSLSQQHLQIAVRIGQHGGIHLLADQLFADHELFG